MSQLKISHIDYSGSLVDGPGVRVVLYLQGCHLQCEECHNQGTWNQEFGKVYDIDILANEIAEKVENRKITISGGEPFFQFDALFEFIKKLEGFDICLYTGLEFEEIPNEIFPYISFLKVGKYKKEFRTTTKPYMGSTNQKMINLKTNKEL